MVATVPFVVASCNGLLGNDAVVLMGDAAASVDGPIDEADARDVADTTTEDDHDASVADVGAIDGPASDVVPSDAVADVGDAVALGDADAALTGTWCQRERPTVALCIDFDEGSLEQAYVAGAASFITGPPSVQGSTAALGVPAVSPPAAFVENVEALDAATNVPSGYYEPFAMTATAGTLRLQFDMDVVTLSNAQEIDLAVFYLPPPGDAGPYRTYMVILSGQGEITTDQGTSSPFSFPSDGAFHNYRLDLALSASDLTFDLYLDDADAGSAPVAHVSEAPPFAASVNASFGLGPQVYGTSGPVQVNYDNVIFDNH
jgi:hypothetical protein